MTFSSPALLWALPLAALPVALHLLAKRRARREPFSDLTLLRRVHARALPRARLRERLLLAARCALLLLLVAAFAGPVIEVGGARTAAAAQETGLDLVILADVSYSMGALEAGRPRWEVLREAASDLLASLGPGDRVACASFSDRVETEGGPRWQSPRECRDLLARAAPGPRGTDYAPALKAAYGLLDGAQRERAVLLLTDGASHGLRSPLPPRPPGAALFGTSFPAAANAAVLRVAPAEEDAPGPPALEVRLRSSIAASSSLELRSGPARGTPRAVALRAGESAVGLALPARGSMSRSGSARLRPDALPADDACYFSFSRARRPRLLVAYGEPSFLRSPNAGFFLKELFGGAKASLLGHDADFLELARLSEARLADYAAVLLVDFKDVPMDAASRLEAFARGGGGVWVLPGARSRPESFRALDAWLPARIGEPFSPARRDGWRPSAAGAAWRGFELGKVTVARAFQLSPKPGSVVRASAASGEPLFVTGTHGAGRVAVWGSTLDLGWSNLALKPVFAAWVQDGLEVAAPARRRTEIFEVKAGEPLRRVWEAGEPAPARVTLRAPAGRETTLWVKDRKVEFLQTQTPGLYTLTEDGGGRRIYAVNLDRSKGESDLSAAARPPWRVLPPESLRERFWTAVRGQDGRPWALGLAALLLLCEMFLALPKTVVACLLLALAGAVPLQAQEGDRLVWTQLRLGPTWDPYPGTASEVMSMLGSVTSVLTAPERRVIGLNDKALFSSPLVILAGRQAPPPLSAEDARTLRSWLSAGGTLWIEDVSGAASSSFDRWVRRALPEVLPESELTSLPPDHVLFRSFFLLRGPSGRSLVRGTLEGVSWGGRTAVVYSRNDILGAWPKDALGHPLLACVPGGEPQRHNAKKLTINILIYALTGSYKADAVHQPYLLQKIRSGIP